MILTRKSRLALLVVTVFTLCSLASLDLFIGDDSNSPSNIVIPSDLAFGTNSSLLGAGNQVSPGQPPESMAPAGDPGVFAAFDNWMQSYSNARATNSHRASEGRGLALAHERQQVLARLIVSDPERALNFALTGTERAALPPKFLPLLEERVHGNGRLDVFAVCPEPGMEHAVPSVIRRATLGGRTYQAFVYGRRLGDPTQAEVLLEGIAVGDLLAVHSDAARGLEPQAAPATGFASSPSDTSGDYPPPPKRKLDFGSPGWTTGQKRLLVVRVEFSDLLGSPVSDSTASNMVAGASGFYAEMSYAQTSFAAVGGGSDITPTFLMPQTASWYGSSNAFQQLRTDARNAASAAGYVLANYDLDLICFGAVPGWNWIGIGNIGSAGAWLRNAFTVGVAAHELGHNYGLQHANFWDTQGQSVVGPGASVEYGDTFDLMGTGYQGDHRNHINVRFKNYLGWLPSTNVLATASSGTYRIYAQDDPLATGPRALKVNKRFGQFPMPTNYWVEFRQSLGANRWLMDGAGLRLRNDQLNYPTLLLDTTPGSPNGKDDSAIVIGRTYSDPDAWTHITPIGKGGTHPESLDIVVNIGNFITTNRPPSLLLSSSQTTTGVGTPVSFEVAATDPNADPLAYSWDFGDGTFGPNQAVTSHSWSTPGDYVVRCRVTDMKGGAASESISIAVGSSSTFRITGRVTEGGEPLENVRVFVSPSQMAYTDSDGQYLLSGLPAATYTVQASLYGYNFTPSNFSNPVLTGPDANNIDFGATALKPKKPWILSPPTSTTVDAGTDAALSVYAAGTPPLYYQWWWESSPVAGQQGGSLVVTNAQLQNSGDYFVIVSNSLGSVTSSVATLTVTLPLAIRSQPQSQLVNIGADALFSVDASGTPPLTYQWRFNTTNQIPGATEATLLITNVTDADAGAYSVLVSGTTSLASTDAWLAVNHLPVLTPVALPWMPTLGAKIKIAELLGTDVDGDAVTLDSLDSTSAQGGTVTIQDEWVAYTPPAGLTGNDSFEYRVTDGRGGFTPGSVTLVYRPDEAPTMNLQIALLGDGGILLLCSGIPSHMYEVQYTDDLSQGWQTIATRVADEFGSFQYIDTRLPSVPARLYRTKSLP